VTIPGRCWFDGDGKLCGPAQITYNTPFPTKNGSWGSGAMNGVLMHTMVGNLRADRPGVDRLARRGRQPHLLRH
jgi:hypothetical protein